MNKRDVAQNQFRKVAELVANGANAKTECKRLGVNSQSYYGWRSRLKKQGSIPVTTLKRAEKVGDTSPLHRVISAQNRLISELVGMLQ